MYTFLKFEIKRKTLILGKLNYKRMCKLFYEFHTIVIQKLGILINHIFDKVIMSFDIF